MRGAGAARSLPAGGEKLKKLFSIMREAPSGYRAGPYPFAAAKGGHSYSPGTHAATGTGKTTS